MQYRTYQKTGEKISALGLGAMRLPVCADGKIDEDKAKEMVDYCLENGVNYFDTAYPYHNGQSEPFMGKALAHARKDILLATKLFLTRIHGYEDIVNMFTEQLEKLRTDYIDFYMMHALIDFSQWEKMKEYGVVDFIDAQMKKGTIRNIGFSAHTTTGEFKKILDDYNWDFAQIQYNYLDEDIQAGKEGVAYAMKKGVPLVVMEPLRGGLLANPGPDITAILDTAKEKKTPAEWGLKWVWDHDAFLVVLSGMTTIEQVKENICVVSQSPPGCLTEDDKDVLEKVKAVYKEKIKVPCTACRYCMPCPQGVNIPAVFECYNQYYMLNPQSAKNAYAFRTMKRDGIPDGKASHCVECGICETQCPQRISIIEDLKNAVDVLEAESV